MGSYRRYHSTQVAPKNNPLLNYQKIVLNRIVSLSIAAMPMRLNLFVKLKHQSNTMILSVGDKYSMPDLLCDVNSYA